VLLHTPKAGSAVKEYIRRRDVSAAATVSTVSAPEVGGEMEQTSDLSDYRDVGGVKVPFSISTVNPAQAITITLTSVEHNKPIDEATFSRPAVK